MRSTCRAGRCWKQDLGVLDSGFFMVPQAQWGFGSSPVIDDGVVYVQADVQKNSFVAAFDVKTGKELWRTPRADVPTWSTPAILEVRRRTQVIVNGFKHAGGYDAQHGQGDLEADGRRRHSRAHARLGRAA